MNETKLLPSGQETCTVMTYQLVEHKIDGYVNGSHDLEA